MTSHHDKKHDQADHIRMYMMVFGALMALTVVTVLVSYWHLPPLFAIGLGLAVATLKAGLVATYFMHLKWERALIYGLLGLTFVMVIGLFVIPILDSYGTADTQVREAPAVADTGSPARH